MKKSERCWSLVAQHEIAASRITEKKINVMGQETEMELSE